MKKVELILNTSPNNLGELSQSVMLRMCLLRREKGNLFTQVHIPVKCRDFLVDCIWSKLDKKEVIVYGFKYNFKSNRFSTNNLYMSLRFPSLEVKSMFLNNLDKFPKIEGYKDVKSFSTQFEDTLIIQADKIWLSNPWKISLFSYLIKLACYKTALDVKFPESDYIKILTEDILNILYSNLYKKKQVYFEMTSEKHNYGGVVALVKGKDNFIPESSKMYNYIFKDEEL